MRLIRCRLGLLAVSLFCSSGLALSSGWADAAAPAGKSAPTDGSAAPNVSETFSSSVDPRWRVAKGDWKIVDGAWQGAELPEDKHGAVARFPLNFTDGVIEFDFRLDGAKGISLSINDAKGHVCRLAIQPAGFQVLKDDHDHEGPDKRAVLAKVERTFEPGTWYHARVEIAGPKMTAQIGALLPGVVAAKPDDAKPVGGENEMIAVPKANFGFTVAGATASFKNLKVAGK